MPASRRSCRRESRTPRLPVWIAPRRSVQPLPAPRRHELRADRHELLGAKQEGFPNLRVRQPPRTHIVVPPAYLAFQCCAEWNSFNIEAQVGEKRVDVPPVPRLERSRYHFGELLLRHRPSSIPFDLGSANGERDPSRRVEKVRRSPTPSQSPVVPRHNGGLVGVRWLHGCSRARRGLVPPA
jgi:hypothetical protein